uniref:NADH-ubiquinone oxidoreductase chain 2 n=1 Tax=Archichauliodes deceptor TaxID=1909206 RepID=A0A343A2U2_9NEOP|nr:NADH dehydrogenase subunit 2 [Archichauliodes deceptor]AOX48536.1 NADH dehydrogenase subunit 2 [Archichauliodes deceptor]
MYMNMSKMMFLICLISGTLISISSNSWFGVWMGLEINLLSFIPLMINLNNMLSNESALKYFLTQALASSILLFSILLYSMDTSLHYSINFYSISQFMLNSSLLLKMGAAPFHFWFPSVMESMSWFNCLLLMTWQKLAPLMLLTYCYQYNSYYVYFYCCLVVGAIGGLNQLNLRTLMAYSSINHLGWMLISMMINENLWLNYYFFYIMLSSIMVLFFLSFKIFHMNQMYTIFNFNPILKFMMLTNLLSLGGLPPFLGFMPKLMVITLLTEKTFYFMTFIMVMSTLITLFFYLRITFSAFMISYPSLKWSKTNLNNIFLKNIFLNMFSLFGFPMILLIYSLL